MSVRLFSNVSTRRARTLSNSLPNSRITGSLQPEPVGNSAELCDRFVDTFSTEFRDLSKMSASDEKINRTVEFIQRAAQMRLRAPLRDASIQAVPLLITLEPSSQTNMLPLAVQMLNLSGQGMVYVQELLEYCASRVARMSAKDFSVFIYECGRHGLRSKHYMDSALTDRGVLKTAESMSQEDRMRCLKGLCKFTSDYKDFIMSQVKKLSFTGLKPDDILVLMRVLRGIGETSLFVRLIREGNFSVFSLHEKYNAIYLLKRSKNFRLESRQLGAMAGTCKRLVSEVSSVSPTDMRKELITTDMTDALDAMASLKIRNEDLLAKIMTNLVDKVAEIKYSPICGLWQSVSDSLGHLKYFHGGWMRIVEELASSEFNLKSFASFQLIFFTSSLGRLNFYSPKIFTALTNVIQADIRSVNDPDMLGTLLFPLERAAFYCPELLDAVLTQTCTISNTSKFGTSPSRPAWRGTLSVVYASLSLGADASDPRLKTLANMLFSNRISIEPEFLSDQDYMRVARLELLLDFPLDIPKWIKESPKFALWENMDKHREEVQAKFGSQTEPQPFFIDAFSTDCSRVPIVLDTSFQEEVMYTWANPDNERCTELVPLATTGSQRLITRYLKSKGFETVSIVS